MFILFNLLNNPAIGEVATSPDCAFKLKLPKIKTFSIQEKRAAKTNKTNNACLLKSSALDVHGAKKRGIKKAKT